MSRPQRSYPYEERCDLTEMREAEHYREAVIDMACKIDLAYTAYDEKEKARKAQIIDLACAAQDEREKGRGK
tara:strand:+ start:537 stop:752 length:216 start_codon:yes stop_codon:yes gene_type:complete